MAARKNTKKRNPGAGPSRPVGRSASTTPLWVRAVIIVIVVAFLGTGILFVAGGAGSQPTVPQGSGDAITDEYGPAVDAALATLDSKPSDPQANADAGDAYYRWAQALALAERADEALPYWNAAAQYYLRALEAVPDNADVMWRRAFSLYYSGSPDAEAALVTFVAASEESTTLATQVTTANDMLDYLRSEEATTPSE